MKSTQAKAYINESLTIEMTGAFAVSQQDAIRAVEIAENDMLIAQQEQNRKDIDFLQDMLQELDKGELNLLRIDIVDWRDELERKVAELKREINA